MPVHRFVNSFTPSEKPWLVCGRGCSDFGFCKRQPDPRWRCFASTALGLRSFEQRYPEDQNERRVEILVRFWALNVCNGGFRRYRWNQLESQAGGFLDQTSGLACKVLSFVMIGAQIEEFLTVLEHRIDDARHFVGRRRNRFGRSETGTLPPVKGSQPTIGVAHGQSGKPEGGIGTVLGLLSPALKHLSSGNVIVR